MTAAILAADALPLGALGWGACAPAEIAVDLPLLAPAGGRIDAWPARAALRRGRLGNVQWCEDGQRLFGRLDVDEAGLGLEEATWRAYRALFAALHEAGHPALLRVWNFVPRINDDEAGLERYRQFNIGRQRAFLEAGHAAFEGAPAACALGSRSGPLSIRFLAGRRPALALENPRQVPAWRYSTQFGPRSPTFSRAVLAADGTGQVDLLVSGTASIVGEDSCHAGDVRAQLAETLANLRAVVDAARARSTARFALEQLDCTVYLRDPAQLEPVRADLAAALGAQSRAATAAVYVQADICRRELLLEIEAHARAPGVLCG